MVDAVVELPDQPWLFVALEQGQWDLMVEITRLMLYVLRVAVVVWVLSERPLWQQAMGVMAEQDWLMQPLMLHDMRVVAADLEMVVQQEQGLMEVETAIALVRVERPQPTRVVVAVVEQDLAQMVVLGARALYL
jgi:hypothetical protein